MRERTFNRGGVHPVWRLLGSVVLTLGLAVASLGQITVAPPEGALPDAGEGVPYSETLTPSGGTAPYTWDTTGAVLPAGLVFVPTGDDLVISGTPTVTGLFSFTVTVDDTGPAPILSLDYTLTVRSIVITSPSVLPDGAIETEYSVTLSATGDLPPYTWSHTGGSLPDGLALSSGGVLSGTPTSAITFSFTVSVDGAGPAATASKTLSIRISDELDITTGATLPEAVDGVAYATVLESTGGSSISWSQTAGTLPPGLQLSSAGSLSGTPTNPGDFTFTIEATGGSPEQTATRIFTLSVLAPLSITTPAALTHAGLSVPYSESLSAQGGLPAYSWLHVGGLLPPGVNLSSKGVLSGIPTALGSFSFTVQVTDAFIPVQTSTKLFTILVRTGLTILTSSLPGAIQDLPYSEQLEAAGGTPPLTWIVTSGELPAGLTLTPNGALAGIAMVAGSPGFTITVTDFQGLNHSRDFSIVVDPPLAAISVPNLPLNIQPAEGYSVELFLAAAHPSPLSGELTLSFTSTAEVPGDDPMTQFSSGSRVVEFEIPAGDTMAVFPSPIMLLAGTVAGNITLTAGFTNGPSNVSVATASMEGLPIL